VARDELKWIFAETGGGLERGLNDAGVFTFKGGIYRYLAREIIQNSCDAQYDPSLPVRITFQLENLGASSIPDVGGLRGAITRCTSYWSHDVRATADLWRATTALDGPTIPCLRISDYNTKGLTGADDERNGNWYLLIRCAGSSAKASSAGGSFGIGKGAPFAASAARTVLYSTKTAAGDVAFQGVALLASHKDDRGSLLQANGFLSNPSGYGIRSENEIPRIFRRSDAGTDIWVVACIDAADWKNELIQSVLESFWPAITLGKLEVTVGEDRIDKDSLESYMRQFSGSEDFTAIAYYEAFKKPTLKEISDLPEIGNCQLYLSIQDDIAQKRVAMIRKTGMVIECRQFRSPLPFTGVFMCLNDVGNERLAKMEPPRHDKWDPNHPTEKANTKIHSVITLFVRAALKRLNPVDLSKRLSVPGLERFLPDQDDGDLSNWQDGNTKGESLEPIAQERPPIIKLAIRKQKPSIEPAIPAREEDSAIGPEIDDEPASDRPRKPSRKVADESDVAASQSPDGTPHKAIAISYRTYLADANSGRYVASIHPAETSAAAIIRIFAVGEDARSQERPRSAMTSSGEQIVISDDGSIGPVELVKGRELRIELLSDTTERLALEVAANEAT